MDGTHPGKSTVQCNQHVQALRFADLPHHQPVGPHPERFLHQAPERDLAFTLQVGLAALEADHIAQRELEFEDFFNRDHAFPAADTSRQAIQHGGLSGLCCAGNQDVQATGNCRPKEPGRLVRQRSELDKVLKSARLHHEFADVDRPVAAGDVRDDDVKPGAGPYLPPTPGVPEVSRQQVSASVNYISSPRIICGSGDAAQSGAQGSRRPRPMGELESGPWILTQ